MTSLHYVPGFSGPLSNGLFAHAHLSSYQHLRSFQECALVHVHVCLDEMSQRSRSVNSGTGVSVSINTGSFTGLIPGSSVSVGPTSAMSTGIQSAQRSASQLTANKVINKVFLKAVSKSGGKKASSFKTFTLRNINS